MDAEHFFYMEYLWKGDTIRKKLEFRADTLLIATQELYKVGNQSIDPAEVSEKHYLCHYNTQTQESVAYPSLGSPIYIVRPNDGEVREEVKLMLQTQKEQPFHIQTLAISDYLSRFYGMPGDWELEKLVKELSQ